MPLQLNLQPKKIKNIESNDIFTWFSRRGRYILLLLNIALFCVYVYRFYLDRDNIVLSDRINSLQAAIDSYELKALKYNNLQEQSDFIKARNLENVDEEFVLNIIKTSIPEKIKVTDLAVNGKEALITSKSGDAGEFSNFIALLVSNDRISDLLLIRSIYVESENSYETELQINYTP